MNYFALLHIEPRFTIDIQALERNYIRLQEKFHPDRYTNAPKNEQQLAQEMTAAINQAYTTLSNPEQRAQHLLSMFGQEASDNTTQADPAFLMEQMELNEAIEAATDDAARESIRNQITKAVTSIQQQLADTLIGEPLDDQQSLAARKLLEQLQYYNRLYTRIQQ